MNYLRKALFTSSKKVIKPYLFKNLTYPFKLPQLAYKYDQLEPFLDSATMAIHHGKHHQTYVTNLNNSLEKQTKYHKVELEQLLLESKLLPEPIKTQVENFGGGHKNHYLYWEILGPKGSRTPVGQLKVEIEKTFKSFDAFKEQFSAVAAKQFGSGWAFLSLDQNNKLVITSCLNQFTPLQSELRPFFTLDVWEHAYYLKFQNRRPDFIKEFWNVVNWDKVELFYQQALRAYQ